MSPHLWTILLEGTKNAFVHARSATHRVSHASKKCCWQEHMRPKLSISCLAGHRFEYCALHYSIKIVLQLASPCEQILIKTPPSRLSSAWIWVTELARSVDWIISMPASGLDFALTKLLSVSLGLWLAQLWLINFTWLCDGWLRRISSTCPSSIACRGLCLTHPAILELGHFWNLSLLNIVNSSLCFICDKMKDVAITCVAIKVVRRQWSPHSHACTFSWQIEFAAIWMSFPMAFACLNWEDWPQHANQNNTGLVKLQKVTVGTALKAERERSSHKREWLSGVIILVWSILKLHSICVCTLKRLMMILRQRLYCKWKKKLVNLTNWA